VQSRILILLVSWAIFLTLTNCQSDGRFENGREFFRGKGYYHGDEIKSFDGKLYAFGAREYEVDGQKTNSFLMVLDTGLNVIWERGYGGIGYPNVEEVVFESFELDQNGNIFLAGGNHQPTIVKCNSQGDVLWEKKYDLDTETSRFWKIIRHKDAFFLLAGRYVAKIDVNGNLIWTYQLPGDNAFRPRMVVIGNWILVAYNSGLSASGKPGIFAMMACLGMDGTLAWKKEIHGSEIKGADVLVNATTFNDQMLLYYRCTGRSTTWLALRSLDTTGQMQEILFNDQENLPICNGMADILLCYSQFEWSWEDSYFRAAITLKDGKYGFCQPNTGYHLTDFVTLDRKKYFIGTMVYGDAGDKSWRELEHSWVIVK
jgi:hypothetical protein